MASQRGQSQSQEWVGLAGLALASLRSSGDNNGTSTRSGRTGPLESNPAQPSPVIRQQQARLRAESPASQQQHLQPSSSLLASGSAATASPASASPRVRAMLRPPGQTLMGPTGLPSTLEGQTSQPASRHRFTSSLLSSSRWLPLICRAGRPGKAGRGGRKAEEQWRCEVQTGSESGQHHLGCWGGSGGLSHAPADAGHGS